MQYISLPKYGILNRDKQKVWEKKKERGRSGSAISKFGDKFSKVQQQHAICLSSREHSKAKHKHITCKALHYLHLELFSLALLLFFILSREIEKR